MGEATDSIRFPLLLQQSNQTEDLLKTAGTPIFFSHMLHALYHRHICREYNCKRRELTLLHLCWIFAITTFVKMDLPLHLCFLQKNTFYNLFICCLSVFLL